MPRNNVDEARYYLLQAYDRVCIAQHYLDLETIAGAKEAVLWAYLVTRSLPQAEMELVTEELEQDEEVPF